MKCPYCEKEMEQGFIQSPHEISWKKGDKRPLFVILSELSFMKGSAVTAFLCRDCQKVIIDYSDENADFNQR